MASYRLSAMREPRTGSWFVIPLAAEPRPITSILTADVLPEERLRELPISARSISQKQSVSSVRMLSLAVPHFKESILMKAVLLLSEASRLMEPLQVKRKKSHVITYPVIHAIPTTKVFKSSSIPTILPEQS